MLAIFDKNFDYQVVTKIIKVDEPDLFEAAELLMQESGWSERRAYAVLRYTAIFSSMLPSFLKTHVEIDEHSCMILSTVLADIITEEFTGIPISELPDAIHYPCEKPRRHWLLSSMCILCICSIIEMSLENLKDHLSDDTLDKDSKVSFCESFLQEEAKSVAMQYRYPVFVTQQVKERVLNLLSKGENS
jgi:hypothetical protein